MNEELIKLAQNVALRHVQLILLDDLSPTQAETIIERAITELKI